MKLEYMHMALEQAFIAKGFTSPNPSVGAVVVKNNQVISTGYHKGPGLAHAEMDALIKAKGHAEGADLYVTLEPCCHYGKTPPCTNAILESKIKNVYFGFIDPNPIISGKGQYRLQNQGIACDYIETPEISDFYKSYLFWTKNHRPFVTAKIALSLDGKYGLPNERLYLSSALLNAFTHQCRKESDAILTSMQTILMDDSRLNARVNENIYKKKVYILDPYQQFKSTFQVNETSLSVKTFSIRDLKSILLEIGKENIQDLFIECGAKLLNSFLKENFVQKLYISVSPKIVGSKGFTAFQDPLAWNASLKSTKIFGNDILYEWDFTCSQE